MKKKNEPFLVFLEDELVWEVEAPNIDVVIYRFGETFGRIMHRDPKRWVDKSIKVMSLDEWEALKCGASSAN